jgi:hypothetical protein
MFEIRKVHVIELGFTKAVFSAEHCLGSAVFTISFIFHYVKNGQARSEFIAETAI